MNLAVIPARGGSKRIPRKNVRPFNGVPVIARTIATVRDSGVFDRVIVSTDDDEIAAVAREAGAEVPSLRPRELADDHAVTRAVVQHAITAFEEIEDIRPVLVGCVYPTSALVGAERYIEALSLLEGQGASYVQTGLRYPHPIERAWHRLGDGRCELLDPEHALTRTQDLEPTYFDAGQFYFGVRAAWLDPRWDGERHMVVLEPWEAVDLDTEADWLWAERLQRLQGPGPDSIQGEQGHAR
jgi:pseudaminic acid cytidylyltransferase